ncbi:MAG: PAS domain S-box protein [Myxacorys chilensis ATA2-1-KO14]|jgi:PAS domain S-box-containing protein|nr:PAS domain S-box protein [Myxacorys chilensis ATA2-1-KO14]
MRAAFPSNEDQRIAKLLSYGILDTESEPAYDDLAILASYICKTPIALVSLVDAKRQWFKSTVGLDAVETHRDLAFCAHAILQPEVLVVPDAREDDRFVNNPLVTGEPYIRFYAGVPLITTDGFALGTLCVIDTQPRTLDSEQINAIAALGRQVISQIELRMSHQKLTQEILEHERIEAERQQVEANLQKERERLKAILDNLTDGIVACDETGHLMLFNHATQVFHGLPDSPLPPDEWAAHFDLYLADGKTPMPVEDIPLFRAFRGEIVHEAEMVIAPVKHGRTRTLLASGQAFFDAAGKKLGAVVAMHDISDRKQAEAERDRMETALRQSEARFQRLAQNLPGTIFQFRMATDGTARLPYINAFCKDLYEVEPEAAQQNVNLILDCVHPDDFGSFYTSIQVSWQTLEPWDWVGRFIMPSGQVKWLHWISRPERQADGSTLWDGLQLDVSDRKQAETALQTALQETEYQSRLLRTVLDSTQDWIFAKDQDFRYVLVNSSYAEGLGQPVEAMLGKDDLELGFSQELVFGNSEKKIQGFRSDDQAALAGEKIHNSYDLATTADGSLRIFDTRKTPLHSSDGDIFAMLGFSRDVTEQYYAQEALRCSEADLKEKAEELEQTLQELQRTQMQMIQAEKMSGLGQLVGGIAHEINNPVNFIHGNITPAWQYAQELLNLLALYQTQVLSPPPAIQALVENLDLEFIQKDLPKLFASMKMGTERIREIVLSLRNFSRLDEAEMKHVDLHEGIDSALVILDGRLKAKSAQQPGIEVVKQYSYLPLVECYAGQLNQVLMNILNNAIYALEELATSRTQQETKDQPSRIKIRTLVINSNWVSIAIADNGPGMSETLQRQVFNPFFTTKPVGKGTGMGMAISYQIISEKHGGKLECFSTLGEGTEFVIQIPICQPSGAVSL